MYSHVRALCGSAGPESPSAWHGAEHGAWAGSWAAEFGAEVDKGAWALRCGGMGRLGKARCCSVTN